MYKWWALTPSSSNKQGFEEYQKWEQDKSELKAVSKKYTKITESNQEQNVFPLQVTRHNFELDFQSYHTEMMST